MTNCSTNTDIYPREADSFLPDLFNNYDFGVLGINTPPTPISWRKKRKLRTFFVLSSQL